MFSSLRPGHEENETYNHSPQQNDHQGNTQQHHRYQYEDEVLMHEHHHGVYSNEATDDHQFYHDNNQQYDYDDDLNDQDLDGDLEDIDEDMPPPLAPPKELHPGRLYALYEFNGPDPSQCDLEFDDAVILLNDEDSYWWLIKKVKDGKIGFAPAECLETPGERLARLNCWKNEELERLHKITDDEDNNSSATSKATKLGKSLFGSLSRKNTKKGNPNNHKDGKSVVFNEVLDYSETVYITDDEFDDDEDGFYEEEDQIYSQDIDDEIDMDDDEDPQIIEEETESDYGDDNPYSVANEFHHSDSVIRYDEDKEESASNQFQDDSEEDIVIQANNSISSTSSSATATTSGYSTSNNNSSSRVQQPSFVNNNSTSTLTNSPVPQASATVSTQQLQQQQFSSPSTKQVQQRNTFIPLDNANGAVGMSPHGILENSPTAARGLMNSGSMATMNSSSIGEYSPSSSSLDDEDFEDEDFSDNEDSAVGGTGKSRRKSKKKEERSTPTKYQVLSSLQLSAAKNNSTRNNANNSSLVNNSSLANLSAVPLQFPNGSSANSSASSTNNNSQINNNSIPGNTNGTSETSSPVHSMTSPLNVINGNNLKKVENNKSLDVGEDELREVKNSSSLISENDKIDKHVHPDNSYNNGTIFGTNGYDGDDETSRISASSNINTTNKDLDEYFDENEENEVSHMKNSDSLAEEIEQQIKDMENDNAATANGVKNTDHGVRDLNNETKESLLETPTRKNKNLFGNLPSNNNSSPQPPNDLTPKLSGLSAVAAAADSTPTRSSSNAANGSGGKLLLSPSKSLSKSKNRLENVQLDDFNKQLDISPVKYKETTEPAVGTPTGRAHVPYFDMLRSASTEDFLQQQKQDGQLQRNTSLVAGTAFSSVLSKTEKRNKEAPKNAETTTNANAILNRSNSATEPRNTIKVLNNSMDQSNGIPSKTIPIPAKNIQTTTTTTIIKNQDGKNSQVVMMMKNQSMSDLLPGYHPKVEEIYSSVFNRADELSLKLEKLKKMLSS